jgi:hypothetical protein
LKYALLLADAIWVFLRDREPKDIVCMTEHFLDDDHSYPDRYTVVATRYYTGNPEKQRLHIGEVNSRWQSCYDYRDSRR